MKTLVAYYSRSGNTRKVAKRIASTLKCDIEEIHSKQDFSGPIGLLRLVYHALMKKEAMLKAYEKDPRDYELVIIGTPIWAARPSLPIITYLKENKEKFKKVAFFCTYAGSGFEDTIKVMKEITGKEPVATLDVTGSEIKDKSYHDKIESFIKDVKAGD